MNDILANLTELALSAAIVVGVYLSAWVWNAMMRTHQEMKADCKHIENEEE
jgi:hypothetical protein